MNVEAPTAPETTTATPAAQAATPAAATKAPKAKGKGGKAKTKAAAKPTAPEAKKQRITIEDNASGPLVLDGYKCKEPKDLRAESKRGQLLKALSSDKGITMNQATSRFEWTPRDFADALRLLAKVNGVVTERRENGHWFVKSAPKAK